MIYITTLFLSVIFVLFISVFISFKSLNNKFYTNTFFGISITTLFIISINAIYITKGKTIFILIPFIIFYLFKKRTCHFDFNFLNIRKKIGLIFFLAFILIIQSFFNYDFIKNIPYKISDDIYDYASNSYQLIKYGNENRWPLLSLFYPSLFSGIQPYHFFEIWLNGIFLKINNSSVVYNLIFVTYPFLIWILLIGLIAILENLNFKKYKLILVLLMFLIGPVYLNFYNIIFNDGNFFDSSVFTIVGFVKQTLPFSYFGQKHLPTYIISCGLILAYLNSNLKLLFSFTLFAIISSIGVFPSFVFASLIFLKQKRIRKHLLFPISVIVVYLVLLKYLSFDVSKEISLKTNYTNYFLDKLNFKGELIRVLEKIFFPLIWYIILYLPFLIIALYKKTNKNIYVKKNVFIYLFLIYLGGVATTIFLYGLNSDQFTTNLLPFYNLVLVVAILSGIKDKNEQIIKNKLFFLTTFCMINLFYLLNFQFISEFKENKNDNYDVTTQKKLLGCINNTSQNKFIAYLLSDSTAKNTHPVFQYALYPAKYLMENNIVDFVNINYPYYKYPFNSSSNVFSPENQLKYFIKVNNLNNNSFNESQIAFLKKYNINWILCAKNSLLPKRIDNAVKNAIYDSISKENYYQIDLNKLE